MGKLKYILMITAGIYTLYYAKNLRFSFSGVLASDHNPVEQDVRKPNGAAPDIVVKEVPIKKHESEKPGSSQALSLEQQLMLYIREQKLCEFIDLVEREKLSAQDQVQLLSKSLRSSRFDELEVYLEKDPKDTESYKSLTAQLFILSKEMSVFEFKTIPQINFSKGLISLDIDALKTIADLQTQASDNIFYTFLKAHIYRKYKDKPDRINEELYAEYMNASYYENPMFKQFSELYDETKNNIVQFYLANKVFKTKVDLSRQFIQGGFWYIYDNTLREHSTQLLKANIESSVQSEKVFGYEKEAYNAYRDGLYYEDYKLTPPQKEFESSRLQPAYTFKDFDFSFSQGCQPRQVSEWRRKLRSL